MPFELFNGNFNYEVLMCSCSVERSYSFHCTLYMIIKELSSTYFTNNE